MSKLSFRSSNQQKRSLKYGGYATISTLVVLAVLILVNALFSQLKLRVDLTGAELYTPGEQTLKTLEALEDEIIIYGLYNQGTEETEYNKRVILLVEEYAALSPKVTFQKIDPLSQPEFANQFLMDDSQTLENGSLVVENQKVNENGVKKFQTIPLSNMFQATTDYSTLTRRVTAFTAEEALTSAIQYVCLSRSPLLYQLQGHSEALLQSDFISYLGYTNYEVKELSLVTENITHLEADSYTSVLVNNPRQDLSDMEYETLLRFLEDGGKLLYLAASDAPSLPNFERLLARYGLSVKGGVMLETSESHYYSYPQIILPELSKDNEITSYMLNDTNNSCVMILPASIEISEERTHGTKVNVLMATSENAIMKAEGNSATVYEEGDARGPFNLAVSAEESVTRDGMFYTTKVVVMGSADFIDSSENQLVTTGNFKFVTIVCDYLQDAADSLFISGKSLEENTITNTTQAGFMLSMLIFALVIPVLIILTGVVIYVRRKHL